MADRTPQLEIPTLAERLRAMQHEIATLDQEVWNPDHDLCATCSRVGCASSYDLHIVRQAVADLALLVAHLAELCDTRASESDRVAREVSAAANGMTLP